ncbi:uncharacterized protein DAT39_008951 [Clarias magur]|uniref:Uncharacterized protein n=1 Tax=Clarias magur TaxID=1594786 RepID=A0A8J4U7M4_CLAMG|nr:uncharacterized protein DAT39_008951 [Clarias magur]
MGSCISGPSDKHLIIEQREAVFLRMLSGPQSSDVLPDVGIDKSLVKYSGLYSVEDLIIQDLALSHVESLGSALATFEAVQKVVGLGAMTLSIALELIIGRRKDSTLDMIHRVFAKQKALGVRDSMDEYLKRLGMYLQQPTRALEETERLEKQLSEQLTRLKNSMLHDDQMSSGSLKHWTNGAAFHLQMLIHAARLKTQSSTVHKERLQVYVASIDRVLNLYQFDLEELLKQYKTYKKSTISVYTVVDVSHRCYKVKDKELEREIVRVAYSGKAARILSDDYVDYMFDNWSKLKELKSYFSDLKENLKELILQKGEFNLQRVLRALNNQRA